MFKQFNNKGSSQQADEVLLQKIIYISQSAWGGRGIEPVLAPRLAYPLQAKDRLAYVANNNINP